VAARAIGQVFDRGLGPELVERGGAKVGDQRAQVADVIVELGDGVADRLGHRIRRGGCVELRGQSDPQGGETLEGLVVQFARPAGAFLLGRR